MQSVLQYLTQTGRDPFGRKFAYGKNQTEFPFQEPTLQKDNHWCDVAVEWFQTEKVFNETQAFLWWGDVLDLEVSATVKTSYAVNLTGEDVLDLEFTKQLLDLDRLPGFYRLRQFYPRMFYYEWQWELFGSLNPLMKKSFLAFYFDKELHLWESFYDKVPAKGIWFVLLLVDIDLDWKNSLPTDHVSTQNFTKTVERVLGMIKISDSTESALENANKVFEQLASSSVVTLYDLWKVVVQFPGALKAFEDIGFEFQDLEVEKIQPDGKARPLRVGQSVFLARIWYLLYVSKSKNWLDNYIQVIKTIDKDLLEELSCRCAILQFEAFARSINTKPAFWISETEFEIMDIQLFIRAIYWFVPEELFTSWSSNDPRLFPVDQEEWQYECWRWKIKNLHHRDATICKIPLFCQGEFNGSVLKVAQTGETFVPINRYAASDL